MDSERTIVASGVIIALIVSIDAIAQDKFDFRIIFGAGGIVLLLGLLAATGQQPARIASGLAIVTATSVVMLKAIPFFGLVTALQEGKQ